LFLSLFPLSVLVCLQNWALVICCSKLPLVALAAQPLLPILLHKAITAIGASASTTHTKACKNKLHVSLHISLQKIVFG